MLYLAIFALCLWALHFAKRRYRAHTVWIMLQDRFELRKLCKRYFALAVIGWALFAAYVGASFLLAFLSA